MRRKNTINETDDAVGSARMDDVLELYEGVHRIPKGRFREANERAVQAASDACESKAGPDS